MRAVIFSNGRIEHPELDRNLLLPDDLIVAADGGLHHVLAFDLLPDLVIGDLDSIDGGLVRRLQSRSIEILQFPPRKDRTDLELALDEVAGRGVDQALVLGAFGGRWDQTFANILLAVLPDLDRLEVTFADGLQLLRLVRPRSPLQLQGKPGETVSLIPLAGDVEGVRTDGLEYPLAGERLRFGATRGVSNVLTAAQATIEIERGTLLCVHLRGSS